MGVMWWFNNPALPCSWLDVWRHVRLRSSVSAQTANCEADVKLFGCRRISASCAVRVNDILSHTLTSNQRGEMSVLCPHSQSPAFINHSQQILKNLISPNEPFELLSSFTLNWVTTVVKMALYLKLRLFQSYSRSFRIHDLSMCMHFVSLKMVKLQ